MKLVVDTNILFSFFRENPVRRLIVSAASYGLELFTPEYAIDELQENKSDLGKYSGLSKEGIEAAIAVLRSAVAVAGMELFKDLKARAKDVSPDVKDAPFFALALKLDAGIWSNEPRLKRQSAVKVFSTADVLSNTGMESVK